MIQTYELDQMLAVRAKAVELLRCAADGDGEFDEHGRTIELVALELDCSLFVTLLARMWAQNVMAEWGEPFETLKTVLLEAALRLEGDQAPKCPRCNQHFSGEHLCVANHEEHCAIRATRDGWDADCSCNEELQQARRSAGRERQLLDLLARVHRDGGHYTEAVGIDRAVQDAHEAIAANLDARKEADRLRDLIREVTRECLSHPGARHGKAAERYIARLNETRKQAGIEPL